MPIGEPDGRDTEFVSVEQRCEALFHCSVRRIRSYFTPVRTQL